MLKKKYTGLSLTLGYLLFLPYDNYYVTDWGNGIVIKGDRYVRSGEWAYNCIRWHLVSKTPKSFPDDDFRENKNIEIDTYTSPPQKQQAAIEFINETLKTKNWHQRLQYIHTYINEDSQIDAHYFRLSATYKGEQWILRVRYSDSFYIKKLYFISAAPYDARYHKPYEELLQEAKLSCPKPQ